MNDLTTQQPSQSSGSQDRSALTIELAKILGLVAPVTMSTDQQTLWLASAVEALEGIWASEVADVSVAVRKIVTRHSQIVPEVSRLVNEQRAHKARMRQYEKDWAPRPKLPEPEYCTPEQARSILKEMGLDKRFASSR